MALRLGYFAHGPWAHQALQRILDNPAFEVCFVATRSVGDPVLENIAADAGLPFFIPGRVNEDAELAHLASFGAELFVSMSFDQIFRTRLLSLPPKGVINCHAGALPFYRGRNVLNWALINGEQRFGVTVHYIVDESIDTGPILQQDFVAIGPDEGYGDLLEKAYHQCAETLEVALMRLREGAIPLPQDTVDSVGFYCGRRRLGDEWLDWRASSAEIHNFVRGITLPGPCARSRLGDQVVAIVRTERILGAIPYRGTPGEVVGRGQNGIVVKTGDSVLRVLQTALVKPEEQIGPVVTASQPIGSRFCPWTDSRIEQLERRIRTLETLLRLGSGQDEGLA